MLEIEEKEEMEPENSLQVKGEEEKMPTLEEEEELAWIKEDLDNTKIKTSAKLITFRERLNELVGLKGGLGGGPHN